MKKVLFCACLIGSLVFCGCTTKTKNKRLVFQYAFNNWIDAQIKLGNFFGQDSCNLDFLTSHTIEGNPLAVPKSDQIKFYYTDINTDGKEDALVTFVADQCDMGNGAMWMQYKLLILSEGTSHKVTDNWFDGVDTLYKGFFHIDTIKNQQFIGTYYEFKETDGHCCPSVKEKIAMPFDKKELIFLNQKFSPSRLSIKPG